MELNERGQKVLEAIVTGYIRSGEPVGSRTVSKHSGIRVSSATIRNVMADLEEMGLLYQPHTSAGRLPTGKGLRLYLDTILELKELEGRQKEIIKKAFVDSTGDMDDLLRRTGQLLARLCQQAGVVLWPRLAATRFKHIEFVRLRPHQVLVVLISKSGLIQHTLVESEEDFDQETLNKYARYLNELLHDVPLAEAKEKILREMESEKALFDELFAKALKLSHRFIQSTLESTDVHIEGQTQLLSNPEFSDVDRMRRILEAFEDKSRIIRLLDKALRPDEAVQIILGPESELRDLDEISLISSPYRRGATVLGALGVIGPLRMDYSRIIPVVEYTATLLSRVLEEAHG